MYKPKGYKVKRLNQKSILERAEFFKSRAINYIDSNTGYFNLGEFVSYLHDNNEVDFEMVIVDDKFTQEEGVASPSGNRFLIPDHVYNALMEGQPRARFTVAHELGHIMMHEQVVHYLNGIDSWHHYEEDSEWQANMFAAHLLVDFEHAKNLNTADQISNQFGISIDAAIIYMKNRRSL